MYRTVKCPNCCHEHNIWFTDLQWKCPNCKVWVAVKLGQK